jgi:4'-phosphopantetheinyl transferase
MKLLVIERMRPVMDNRSWCLPPQHIELGRNEVHVWSASLDLPNRYLSQLAQTLSGDEHRRAEQFYIERDKRRFVAGRGLLRVILGHYLHVEPRQLQFCYGMQGKPYLTGEFYECALRFSVAHSHELAIYAFTLGEDIGVDLEHTRILPEAEKIASRLFSTRENAAWLRLPAEQKRDAFYVCWTCKEAYVKALGNGLAQSLGQLDVSSLLREPARSSWVILDPVEKLRWSLETMVPAPDYIGALAIALSEYSLSCFQWKG